MRAAALEKVSWSRWASRCCSPVPPKSPFQRPVSRVRKNSYRVLSFRWTRRSGTPATSDRGQPPVVRQCSRPRPAEALLYRLAVVVCLLFCCSAALAHYPCTPPICDPTTADGLRQCAAKADWITEGTIEQLTDHYGPHCEPFGCSSQWYGVTVTLGTDMKMLKGAIVAGRPSDMPGRSDMVKSASHCFSRFVKIRPAMIGQRVRLFGTERSVGPNTGPGFFAFEMLAQ